jgi:hypothetical protein
MDQKHPKAPWGFLLSKKDPAFFCSRAAAAFRQGFISPKIGIYPVSIYQESKMIL